jgi:hypothetical protein
MATTAVYWNAEASALRGADLAGALAHSADGVVVHADDTRALITTPDEASTAYLHQLCEADDRIASYEVR